MQPGGVQSHSRLLLAMYGYGKDSKQLSIFSDDELRRSEVDHMIPRAWQANWNDLKFSKKEVIDYVEKRAGDFPNLDVTAFAKVIARDDFPMVMVRYNTAPNKNEYQILEMIGNRWILSKGLNGSAGNDSWAKKRKAYSKVGTRVPANNDSLGIDAYKQTALFGYKEVIDRSLFICEEVRRQLVDLSKRNAKNPT